MEMKGPLIFSWIKWVCPFIRSTVSIEPSTKKMNFFFLSGSMLAGPSVGLLLSWSYCCYLWGLLFAFSLPPFFWFFVALSPLFYWVSRLVSQSASRLVSVRPSARLSARPPASVRSTTTCSLSLHSTRLDSTGLILLIWKKKFAWADEWVNECLAIFA